MAGSPKPDPALPGLVYTFYSYKGGVGRSMALVNVGVSMALAGHRILLVDWDLEAPGLEVFFQSAAKLQGDPADVPGIVDLLEARQQNKQLPWQDCVLKAHFLGSSIDIISAGRRTPDYRQRVQQLDWATLYDQHQIGNYIDWLRTEWRTAYDFVLIDSRTGITDIGDICTVLLPDVLVLLFVSNRQNINGIKAVMERALNARKKLPVNRNKLIGVPLPGRDEIYNEYDKAMEWRGIYAKELGYLFKDWLPKEIEADAALNKLFIPYVTNWSFGERIPVLESGRELQDPTTIGAAYQRVATLFGSRLDWYSLDASADAGELHGTRVELQRAREEARATQEELENLRKRRKSWLAATIGGSSIVGVLAAIALPAYQDYTIRSRAVEGLSLASSAKAAVAESYAMNGHFPDSNEAAGLPKEPASGASVQSVMVGAQGRILVTFNDSDPRLSGTSLEFVPEANADGVVTWQCGSKGADFKYLPAGCRQVLPAVQPTLPEDSKTSHPEVTKPSDEERFVAQLFDADKSTRERAYQQIQPRRYEQTLVDALLDYASAHLDNQDGVYNAVVALKDMSRTVTQPRREQITRFCAQASRNGAKTAAKCDELLKWVATPR